MAGYAKKIKLYWSTSLKNGRKNFGDWLSPILCERLSGCKIEYASPERCDLMAVGSILQKAKNNWFCRRIHVWGSGLIEYKTPYNSKHYYHAVRGKMTAESIVNQTISTVGDPGLLCDMLLQNMPSGKLCSIGVVPHYKDQGSPLVKSFLERNPHALLLNVFLEPLEFIKQVSQCEVVLSSSLHGLIVADSLGVPNAWIHLSDQVRGSGFKYKDYYTVFGLEADPFTLTESTTKEDVFSIASTYFRPNIKRIKKDLLAAFPF